MIALLLLLIPLITGFLNFFIRGERAAKNWSLLASVLTFIVAIIAVLPGQTNAALSIDSIWLPSLGARFSLQLDGIGKMLCFLTAIAYPIVFIATYRNEYRRPGNYHALMLLLQAGLMGVFLSTDALLFYFFWELALIPAYFLCSAWGGEKRIPVTIKFFIYTFIGSLLMLIGIIYMFYKTPDHSFALSSFMNVKFSGNEQNFVFWLFFIAFAIKMPIFPFHTWQPDTYEQAPTSVTMILSGVMVKMGLLGVVRWLLPVFPDAALHFSRLIIILSVIGLLYASFIAIRQDDFKRMIAYSSIAHVGIMSAALFASGNVGTHGAIIQMFNHGINVIGLWIVADAIEHQIGTRKFSEMGGLAQKAPALAIFLFVLAMANVALPLTNSFIGEFMMFNGIFSYSIWIAAFALISIILSAVYSLNMIKRVLFGSGSITSLKMQEIRTGRELMLILIAILIVFLGVYPQPLLNLTVDTVQSVLLKFHL